MAAEPMAGQGEPDGAGRRRTEAVRLPNLITYVRLALLPVFVWLILTGSLVAALIVLAVVGLSDFVDGFLARRRDAATTLGARLDPLADRLAAITVVGSFAVVGFLPWPFLVVLVVPDLVLLVMSRGQDPPSVSWVGKTRTALLLAGFPLVLVGHIWPLTPVIAVGLILVSAGVIGHLIAAIHYGFVIVQRRTRASRRR